VSMTWTVSVSANYKAEPEPSEEDKRAAEYLDLMLNDRIDELIAWARGQKDMASGALLRSIKAGGTVA
jgi:hypothetical protein